METGSTTVAATTAAIAADLAASTSEIDSYRRNIDLSFNTSQFDAFNKSSTNDINLANDQQQQQMSSLAFNLANNLSTNNNNNNTNTTSQQNHQPTMLFTCSTPRESTDNLKQNKFIDENNTTSYSEQFERYNNYVNENGNNNNNNSQFNYDVNNDDDDDDDGNNTLDDNNLSCDLLRSSKIDLDLNSTDNTLDDDNITANSLNFNDNDYLMDSYQNKTNNNNNNNGNNENRNSGFVNVGASTIPAPIQLSTTTDNFYYLNPIEQIENIIDNIEKNFSFNRSNNIQNNQQNHHNNVNKRNLNDLSCDSLASESNSKFKNIQLRVKKNQINTNTNTNDNYVTSYKSSSNINSHKRYSASAAILNSNFSINDLTSTHHHMTSTHSNNNTNQLNIEKEILKRKHCEKQINELHKKQLELEEQLAVATAIDHKKEIYINKLQKYLLKTVESWKQKESQTQALINKLQQDKNIALTNENNCINRVKFLEDEMKELNKEIINEKVKYQDCQREKGNEIINLKKELNEFQKTDLEKSGKLEELQNQITLFRDEKDSLEQKIIQLNAKIEEDKLKYVDKETELVHKVEVLTENNEKLSAQHESIQFEYENLIKEAKLIVQESELKCHQLIENIEVEKRAKDGLQVSLNLMEEKLENTINALTYDHENKMKKLELDSMEIEKNLIENHKSEINELNYRYKKEIESLKQKFQSEIEQKTLDYEDKITVLNKKVDMMQNEINSLNETNKTLEHDRNMIRQNLKQMLELQMKEAMQLLGLSTGTAISNSNSNNIITQQQQQPYVEPIKLNDSILSSINNQEIKQLKKDTFEIKSPIRKPFDDDIKQLETPNVTKTQSYSFFDFDTPKSTSLSTKKPSLFDNNNDDIIKDANNSAINDIFIKYQIDLINKYYQIDNDVMKTSDSNKPKSNNKINDSQIEQLLNTSTTKDQQQINSNNSTISNNNNSSFNKDQQILYANNDTSFTRGQQDKHDKIKLPVKSTNVSMTHSNQNSSNGSSTTPSVNSSTDNNNNNNLNSNIEQIKMSRLLISKSQLKSQLFSENDTNNDIDSGLSSTNYESTDKLQINNNSRSTELRHFIEKLLDRTPEEDNKKSNANVTTTTTTTTVPNGVNSALNKHHKSPLINMSNKLSISTANLDEFSKISERSPSPSSNLPRFSTSVVTSTQINNSSGFASSIIKNENIKTNQQNYYNYNENSDIEDYENNYYYNNKKADTSLEDIKQFKRKNNQSYDEVKRNLDIEFSNLSPPSHTAPLSSRTNPASTNSKVSFLSDSKTDVAKSAVDSSIKNSTNETHKRPIQSSSNLPSAKPRTTKPTPQSNNSTLNSSKLCSSMNHINTKETSFVQKPQKQTKPVWK